MPLSEYGSNQFSLEAALIPEYQIPSQSYLLAESLDELRTLNEHAELGAPLLSVGLRLIPDAFDADALTGVRVSELPALAPEVRRLGTLTVRGCFVRGKLDGLHGKALGRFFRAAYESAKQMTVILPCAMPYLCVEGGLAALAYNRTEHPETLDEAITAAQIVAMQNQTAFMRSC
ncbi:MAG: hypothetical protein E7425_08715 [Ruminococcaceae bacterium]|nr:hypothetical protein [Oscillospiraceae bacterium]